MDFIELAKQSPPVLYLGAAIYLFHLFRTSMEANALKLETLLDRYHQLVVGLTQTLSDLTEKLNEDDKN